MVGLEVKMFKMQSPPSTNKRKIGKDLSSNLNLTSEVLASNEINNHVVVSVVENRSREICISKIDNRNVSLFSNITKLQ